ncbi:MAG: pyridoxal phosphate-dependent aminotransferase [Terracidiphilus sp.]
MESGCRVSRRSFMRIAGAVAAAGPILTEAHFAWGQSALRMPMNIAPGAVLINANENPLGPCQAACEAIAKAGPMGGRYDYALTLEVAKIFSEQQGLKPGYLAVYAGSSEPLHYTVLAFTSPEKGFVIADPGYEAGMRAAAISKAKLSKVPLKADHAHDVKAMIAADPTAGVIYICNPNNPTGTITPKEDIVWALENKPKGSILLVDEAYIHLSDVDSCIDMVKADKDLVILRTFSKIYGMAGIRCGFAIGRPDLLEKLQAYGQNPMPITGAAAATASLKDETLIPTRKKIIANIRNDTFEWLAANNYSFIPSQSNCFMIDTKRDGKGFYADMVKKNVYIGRVWPVWPTYVRVTVGSKDDMAKFKVAFKQVMDSPATAMLSLPEHQDSTPFSHLG